MYETGQGWTMTFGSLEGGSGGTNKQILEAKLPIFLTFSSEPPLKIPRFHCLPLACFIPWMFIHCQIRKRHLTDFSQASLRELQGVRGKAMGRARRPWDSEQLGLPPLKVPLIRAL